MHEHRAGAKRAALYDADHPDAQPSYNPFRKLRARSDKIYEEEPPTLRRTQTKPSEDFPSSNVERHQRTDILEEAPMPKRTDPKPSTSAWPGSSYDHSVLVGKGTVELGFPSSSIRDEETATALEDESLSHPTYAQYFADHRRCLKHRLHPSSKGLVQRTIALIGVSAVRFAPIGTAKDSPFRDPYTRGTKVSLIDLIESEGLKQSASNVMRDPDMSFTLTWVQRRIDYGAFKMANP